MFLVLYFGLNFNSFSSSNEPETSRYIVANGQLFSEMSSNTETIVDEKANKTSVPSGIIGEITKGTGIKSIHRIRYSRMQVTLEDGRKGWVDIHLVSPSPEKDAYLMTKLGLDEIKAQPEGASAIPITNENKKVKFKRNTPLRVLEWKHMEEKNKTRVLQSGKWWVKVEIEGYTGWIEQSSFRYNNQMFDTSIPLIWYPIHWINNLLGDGFFAGLIIFMLLVFPMTIGFALARLISSKLRFLPNFVLYFIIILTGVIIYSQVFMSVWDASVFSSLGVIGMGLLGILIFIALAASFAYFRKRIYETRCPDCKHWEGEVLESKLLSDTIYKHTTKWTYSDGTTKREVSHHQIQSWEDFCNCGHCGFCWKIKRIETNDY
jgi:hypothetical protein